MTIQEAIRSGKRFRRQAYHSVFWYANEWSHNLTVSDVLATDWEVDEEKFEVTEREIADMLTEIVGDDLGIYVTIKKLRAGKYK